MRELAMVFPVGGRSSTLARKRSIASAGDSQSSAVVSLSSCFGVCPPASSHRKNRVS